MPWFVNWDDYKTNFEQEAAKILGHPVHVIGSASASILPSPSLTFTDVRVGSADSEAMMTVERFEVTIELTPLLQGEFRVVAMKLDRPNVRVSVDRTGAIDWLRRPAAAEALDPDKVVLAAVAINDGSLSYRDARSGVALAFEGITASVEARSLAGPWRADGSYIDGDTAVPFSLATGRRLDDGTIRLKADVAPRQWPVDLSVDGVVSHDPLTGLTYSGTYTVAELVENVTGEAAPAGEEAGPSGWRSEGAFVLTGNRLAVDKAILSNGPADRPSSIAGALRVDFGDHPTFTASAEARQLDLDRALGGGPSEPVEVSAAADRLVAWLTSLPIPDVPGTIAFNMPAIVVGGSVIQDVSFTAAPAAAGWKIDGLRARLPGQASITADGVLTTDGEVGFVGGARLAVAQPATFASWWRGRSNAGAGRQLAAFDISGETEIAPGRISVNDIDARIGDATITGRFAWSEAARDGYRHLGTDLMADRIDFTQVRSLAELIVGRDLTGAGVLADSYSVILSAGALQFDDIRMNDVAINAEYSDDVLKIVRFSVGDLGGTTFKVLSGRIDQPTTDPRGELSAQLEVESVDGLALIAGRFFPDSGLFEWLGRTAEAITPAFISARITAPPDPGGSGFRIAIEDGVAGSTSFDVEIESRAARLATWRDEPASLTLLLDSPDSAALARQLGLAAVSSGGDGGAHLEIRGAGVPRDGLDTTIIADVAGVIANASGKLAFPSDFTPVFAGSFGVSAFDLGPLIATAGLSVPGAMEGTAVDLDGTIAATMRGTHLEWRNGQIGGRAVGGQVKVGRGADLGWRVDGDLAVDKVDLGWLMSLGLGFPLLPTGDQATPWSKTPFSPPGYGPLSGKLTVAAEHLAIGDTLDVANARLAVALQPQRIDLDLTEGHIAGGAAVGGLSIHNVDGNANLTGQIGITGAALESFVWRLDDRAVATGVFDVSANFEATGRSPAGLVSSMTGGGAVTVRDGEARYVNPNAARMVVRASDLGQEFTEDALRIALAEQIDADTLRFSETGGAFTIAAGAIRLRGVSVRDEDVQASGNAVIDLNAMTLDSDWTLTFDAGDSKVEGTEPKVGIVFRGAVAAPARGIDALPFGSYLNTRREARILEIIAMEEADRAERERLSRLLLKLRQDAARSERLAREAAEAEQRRRELAVAMAQSLFRLHVERETLTAKRVAAALKRAAEVAAAESAAAAAAASAAWEHATAERRRSDALGAALPALVQADEEAAATVSAAASASAAVEVKASAAGEVAAETRAAADRADAAALAAIDAETSRTAEAATAEQVRAEAATAFETAAAAAIKSKADADAAEREEAAARQDLDRAGRDVAEALVARDNAVEAARVAEAALAEVEVSAEAMGATRAAAAQDALAAAAEKARLRTEANMAADLSTEAASAREQARRVLAEAEEVLASAEAAYRTAVATAAAALGVADAMAPASDADAEAIAAGEAARTAAVAADRQQLARKAKVDHANQILEVARADFQSADGLAADAGSKAAVARAAVNAAISTAAEAAAAAERAVAGNASMLNTLSEKGAARDTAFRDAETRRTVAEAVGAAFDEARARAQAAADRAEAARMAADTAAREQSVAAEALAAAASDASAAGFAVSAAAVEREQAVAAAAQAREAANAASAAATAAGREWADLRAAYAAAAADAEASHAARLLAQDAAKAAGASATRAEADAASAAERARSKAAEANAAAARLLASSTSTDAAAVPTPRTRRQPISLVPEALAGDEPLVIVPAQ